MQEALSSSPSADDTDLDREELEAAQKTAQEKFNAVYRQESSDELDKVLKDPRLGLPKDIAEAMSTGRPIVVEEEKAITLRNKVRRYLVGREQHEDGQFWPLISRVRIYGEFEVLSNGVVLVDLPGLNDPNPAREQVTKKYLEEARYIWLVCNSQTGIDRVFTQVLRDNGFFFRLFLEGRLGAFSVVATRIDDINLEAVLAQMGTELEDFDGELRRPAGIPAKGNRRLYPAEPARHRRGHRRACGWFRTPRSISSACPSCSGILDLDSCLPARGGTDAALPRDAACSRGHTRSRGSSST